MAPKPDTAADEGLDIPDPANDAPEPIDVDLGEGAAPAEGDDPDALPPKAAVEEDEPLPPKPAARPGNRMPANKRINQLTAERDTIATERNAFLAELESLRPKAGKADVELPQWQHATFVQAKRALTSDLNLLQHQLAAAKADGTKPEVEADITTKIAALSAEKQTVDSWLSQNKAPVAADPAAKPEPKPEPQPQRQRPPISEEAATWYAANPWAIHGHRDFDEEMADEAHGYAAKLEARLKRERRSDLIDTDWYYGRIMANQKAKYPDVDFGEEDLADAPPAPKPNGNGRAAVPPMTRARGVAPVTRSNGGAATSAGKVNLTAEEHQMALNTAVGIINPETGKPWSVKGGSPAERLRSFAINKVKMAKEDKENPQRR